MTHHEHLPYAFVAKIKAKEGKESELRELMTGAIELANAEEGTEVWFAVTTSPDTFWVFDAFPTQEARQAHADGEIVSALTANSDLLAGEPEILPADVLASKLP